MVSTRKSARKSKESVAQTAAHVQELLEEETKKSAQKTKKKVQDEADQERVATNEKLGGVRKSPRRKGRSRNEDTSEPEVKDAVTESVIESASLPQDSMVDAPQEERAVSKVKERHVAKGAPASDKTTREGQTTGNGLTTLIPGYVAPMKLDTSSLDHHRGKLDDLRRAAERTDVSTAGFVVKSAESHASAMKKTSTGHLPTTYASLYSNFKQGIRPAPSASAGAGWFGMTPTPMTDELKTDLVVIANRNYLDPKRFYKSSDSSKNKVLQLGTVIEGSAEFYSSRLTKKQRRANLTEEIMADPSASDYTRKKYKSMQQSKSEKGRARFKKKKLSKSARRGY